MCLFRKKGKNIDFQVYKGKLSKEFEESMEIKDYQELLDLTNKIRKKYVKMDLKGKWFSRRDYNKAVKEREALETIAKHTEPKKENKRFLIMKEGVIYDLNKIDMIESLKLDFFRADYNLTRKKSKPYLCQICKLNETCQNNFDYECIEASDFLFNKDTIFTVKDDFLDSLIKKSNIGLRDKTDDVLEKEITKQLTDNLHETKILRVLVYFLIVSIFLLVMYILFGGIIE